MTKEELTTRLGAAMEAKMVKVISEIADNRNLYHGAKNDFTVKDVIDLTFHARKDLAFRAAWLLEHIFFKYYCLGDHLEDFLSRFSQQMHPGPMRHYGKILAFLTGKQARGLQPGQLEKIDFEPLIGLMFDWLINEKVLVATKVHAMQALANLAPRYPWIKDELLETIAHLEDLESIAFFGRAKQVKKQLKKIKPENNML
ncbi:hypothetical protein QG516_20475 [Pedobacter gandavensis]|uniref:hypothetical protein n=1 Tax=Pedobacter gandavensis TaxID=2679963 RepID=UPI00247A9358|nr:hypothetical protein [Pedobacter gandavensis]WGQ08891.1 hypothetical protein QG516_20475 [Pedobacter gandavensis]